MIYLDNREFCAHVERLKELRADGSADPVELADMERVVWLDFHILATRLVDFAKFKRIESEDAVQDAVIFLSSIVDRYEPAKGKAFNYFTTCLYNFLRQQYRTASNYATKLEKFYEDQGGPRSGRVNRKIPRSGDHANYDGSRF